MSGDVWLSPAESGGVGTWLGTDTISDREAHLPVSGLEEAGLERLESHFLNVERFGSAQVLGRQRRGNPRRHHDGMV
jgi:hypothetical protein